MWMNISFFRFLNAFNIEFRMNLLRRAVYTVID